MLRVSGLESSKRQSRTTASDETAVVRTLLRESLPTSALSSFAPNRNISHVAIDRVHFSAKRPIQLQLTLHDVSGWHQQLIAEWLGSEADAHAQRERQSLRKSRRAQLSRDDRNSIIVLPEWGLVVRRPGLDSKLPGLRLLHHPDEAAGLLKSLKKTKEDKVRVELVAHRLGKRAVLRITTVENDAYYVRLRGINSSSGRIAYKRHQELFTRAEYLTAIAIPEPLHFESGLGAAVFGSLQGTPPEYAGYADLSQCHRVSEALHALQSIDGTTFSRHTAEDEYAILLQLFDRTKYYFPKVAELLKEPMQRVGIGLRSSDEGPCVVAHRDIHQKQLLMSASSVGILDFDTVCCAHPALDLGNFQAHVYLESQRMGFDSAPLEAALSNKLPNISISELSVWRCSALLRLAMIYTFTQEEKTAVSSLIKEASTCRLT